MPQVSLTFPMEYISPAPLVDVAFEQLAYLMAHGTHCELRACPICKRLERVTEILMIPFARPVGS